MIIDGTKLILGRLASFAAKSALNGEEIVIVNCEKVYVSGSKKNIKGEYKEALKRGHPLHGPFLPKMADRIVRRTIRGMLPYKRLRGENALKRIKCYLGVPADLKSAKLETVKGASLSKLPTTDYISLDAISKHLGRK